MNKKYVSLILVLTLVIGMVPVLGKVAYAGLYPNTITEPLDFTNETIQQVYATTKCGIRWDNGVLYLDGANIDCSGQTKSNDAVYALKLPSNTHIEVVSDSTIKSGDSEWFTFGIYVPNDPVTAETELFISGAHTLSINAGSSDIGNSFGIYAGTINIGDAVTLNVTAGKNALNAFWGSLTVENSTIYATATDMASDVCAIRAYDDINVDCNSIVSAANTQAYTNMAVYAVGELNFADGTDIVGTVMYDCEITMVDQNTPVTISCSDLCEIDGIKYKSLSDAISVASNANKTVKLLKNIVVGKTIEITKGSLTIDLAGKVLSIKSGKDSNILKISKNTSVTIIDSDPTAIHYFDDDFVTWQYTENPSDYKILGGCITGAETGDEYTIKGGAIRNEGTLTINGGNIVGNSAQEGGGIYNAGTLSINAGTIIGNSGEYYGGGIFNSRGGYFASCNLYISSGSILYNYGMNGGGICNRDNLYISSDSIMANNEAEIGGAIYSDTEGEFILTDSELYGNEADKGGAVYVDGGDTFIKNGCRFYDNRAEFGGAIYRNDSSREFIIFDSTITNNINDYGAIYALNSFTLGGNITISENVTSYDNRIESNVYLVDCRVGIATPSDLSSTSYVGITLESNGSLQRERFLTYGIDEYDEATSLVSIFKTDDTKFMVDVAYDSGWYPLAIYPKDDYPMFDNCFGTYATNSDIYEVGSKYSVGYNGNEYLFAGWSQEPDNSYEISDYFDDGYVYYAIWKNNDKVVITNPMSFANWSVDGISYDQGWSWNLGTKVLTLNNVTLDCSGNSSDENGLYLQDDVTINLSGKNYIYASTDKTHSSSYGLYNCNSDLIISGNGELNVYSNKVSSQSYAIECDNLTVDKNVTVNAYSNEAYYSFGISAENVEVKPNATLNVCSEEAYESIGLKCCNLSAQNACIIAKSKGCGSTSGDSYGVECSENLVLQGGSLTAESGDTYAYTYGIKIDGNVTSSGIINSISGLTNENYGGYTMAMSVGGDTTILGGSLKLKYPNPNDDFRAYNYFAGIITIPSDYEVSGLDGSFVNGQTSQALKGYDNQWITISRKQSSNDNGNTGGNTGGYSYSDSDDSYSYVVIKTTTSAITSSGITSSAVTENTKTADDFKDLDTSMWYCDGISYCIEHGLMGGVSEDEFNPTGDSSRAMVVTMLWRLAGSPYVDYAVSLKDVDEDQWYTEAVRWAESVGIVGGNETGNFNPGDSVTREQLAAMIYRYEKTMNKGGFDGEWMFNLDYPDTSDVSDWASESMHWIVMNGVINGKDNKLVPLGDASRAELATMMQRYCTLN